LTMASSKPKSVTASLARRTTSIVKAISRCGDRNPNDGRGRRDDSLLYAQSVIAVYLGY
jgi:hypothetical protein